MGLTMRQRRAVTKAIATRYKRADKTAKGVILDELCATTGWHRNHARKALALALKPRVVRPRAPRAPKFDADTIVALRFCWPVLGAPTGKRLAPVMGELVPTLRRFGELDITGTSCSPGSRPKASTTRSSSPTAATPAGRRWRSTAASPSRTPKPPTTKPSVASQSGDHPRLRLATRSRVPGLVYAM
jgi:hypothetical protein